MEITSYLLGKNASGGGVTPTGTISITENGTHDVTNYASANVNVNVSPTKISDVNTCINEFKALLENAPSTYETLTDNAVTLYTPDSNYTIYFIFRKSATVYKVGWVRSNNSYYGVARAGTGGKEIQSVSLLVSGTATFKTANDRLISTNDFASLEDCLTGIQSRETTYTTGSSSDYKLRDEGSLYFSNGYIEYNGELVSAKKISSNETIEKR